MAQAVRRRGPGRRRHPGVLIAWAGTVGVLGAVGGTLAQPPAPEPPVNVTPRQQPPAPTTPAPATPYRPMQPPTPPPVNVTTRPPTTGPGGGGQVAAEDGQSYPVSAFVLRYGQDTRGLPLLESIARTDVELGRVADGYVSPRDGVPTVRMRISDAADRGIERYYPSAIAAVTRAVVNEFNRRGIIAVIVAPSEEDIYQPEDRTDPNWGKDLRPAGRTDLGIIIRVGLVKQLRTIGVGERVPVDERINNPAHLRIIEHSPIQPATEDTAGAGRRDLIRRDELDEYLLRLNRYPGRQVSTSLAPSEEPGGVVLDYLVNENKPWTIYGQVSNTGTKQTNEWRERLGFINTQLTNNDDIFSIDYITSGFDQSHAVVGSYEAPFFGSDRLRWRAYGTWNQFTASEVGITGEQFTGDGWTAGGELIDNIYQRGDIFLDLFGGARWQHVHVTNEFVGITGDDDFFLPYVGLRADRFTDAMNTSASIKFETNIPSVAGTDKAQLNNLGRFGADQRWSTLQWDLNHSMYLEPWLFPEAFRDPGASGGPLTLAHELALSFRGQYAFGYRLIPNNEEVIGGLYTVRGYPESIVAGDTVLIGSVEYRFHIPRALGIQPNPAETPLFGQPFRWTPQQPFGRADWDLIGRGVFDAGRVYNSDRLPFERDQTLLGAGVGLELQFKRNVSIRGDWGIALEDVPGQVTSGSSRFHFVATILY